MSFSKDNKDQKKNSYFFDNRNHKGADFNYNARNHSFLKDLPYAHVDPNKIPYQPNANPFIKLKETKETKSFDDYFKDYKKAMEPRTSKNTEASASTSSYSSQTSISSPISSEVYYEDVYNVDASCSSWTKTQNYDYNHEY